MKKLIFLIIFTFPAVLLAEVADTSFIIKGGTSLYGVFYENLSSETLDVEDQAQIERNYNLKVEFHGRSKWFNSLYWGAGVGYIYSGTLSESLGGSDKVGIDYYPIYLLLHAQYESYHYYDWDFFFTLKGGVSYEKDKGRMTGASGFSSHIVSVPSPYFGAAFGFEKNNFIIEFFYDLTAGASTDVSNVGDGVLITKQDILGVNLGYRINSGWFY